jgi:hypothetical protein
LFVPFGTISGRVRYLSLLQSLQTNYGPTKPTVLWVLVALKAAGLCETNHPALSDAEVSMSGAISPFPHIPSWCAQRLYFNLIFLPLIFMNLGMIIMLLKDTTNSYFSDFLQSMTTRWWTCELVRWW